MFTCIFKFFFYAENSLWLSWDNVLLLVICFFYIDGSAEKVAILNLSYLQPAPCSQTINTFTHTNFYNQVHWSKEYSCYVFSFSLSLSFWREAQNVYIVPNLFHTLSIRLMNSLVQIIKDQESKIQFSRRLKEKLFLRYE